MRHPDACSRLRPGNLLRPGTGFIGVAALATGLVVAGCGNGSPPAASTPSTTSIPTTEAPSSVPSTTSTTAAPLSLPAGGTYTNGPTGTPHTYFVLSVETNGAVSGTVNYLYQDGSSRPEFSFAGTASGGQAQLTSLGGGPGHFSATYTATTFVLGGCTSYLRFVASASQCTFTLTSSPQ
jgi:hypothetical protein